MRDGIDDELTGFLERTELLYRTDHVFRRRLLTEGQLTVRETLSRVRRAA